MTSVARRSTVAISATVLAFVAWAMTIPAATAQQRVGVSSAVNPDATGTPPGGTVRQLLIGQQVVYHERIVTAAAGQTQILFLDESAMTIAPNSDITVDEFVYDPGTGKGQMALSATQGVLRFVGGKLSKNENAVTLLTPTAALGVRGGVFLMDLGADGHLDVVFLYGKSLKVTGTNGVSQTITRAGFGVSVTGRGASPSSPGPLAPGIMKKFLAALDGHAGSNAGSKNPPTDTAVANSSLGSTISGNFAASIEAANQGQPPSGQPQPVNVSSIQSNQQINSVQGQSQTSSIGTTGVVVYPLGIWIDAFNDGSLSITPGFTSPFGTVSNGKLTLSAQGGSFPHQGGTIPAVTGLANFGPPGATDSNGQPIVGAGFLAPDQSLFFGYGNNPGAGIDAPGGKTSFVFAGTPTVNVPTSGTGTYNGYAFGGVFNNGVSYVATGGFNASYNFGSFTGAMTISNLDGHTFGGPITGIPGANGYAASLSGGNMAGAASGFFFGPGASTTGGFFAAVSTLPGNYHVTGVFGGVNH